MTSDTLLDTADELELVRDWYRTNVLWREALDTAVANLSAESLADVDIRESLTKRLRNLEESQRVWHTLAVHAHERRVQRFVACMSRPQRGA